FWMTKCSIRLKASSWYENVLPFFKKRLSSLVQNLFGCMVYAIWKFRNEAIFRGAMLSIHNMQKHISKATMDLHILKDNINQADLLIFSTIGSCCSS
ncbi:hypothetical protein Droror1_Dr00017963, partial [Drosera rotundifolia]